MATYGIAVYKNFVLVPKEAKVVLEAAGIEVFDTDEVQVLIDAFRVDEAVEILNDAGFDTDEDPVEDPGEFPEDFAHELL